MGLKKLEITSYVIDSGYWIAKLKSLFCLFEMLTLIHTHN